MLETIFDTLNQVAPQAAIYAAIILVVGLLVYHFTKFWVATNKTNQALPEIQASLIKIDRGLNTLNKVLLEKNIISQSCYSNVNSPRALNDLGRRLLPASGADRLLAQQAGAFLNELEQKPYDSPLEVEREALNLLLAKMDDAEFRELQNFAYNHPQFDGKPLTYTDILFVMSLVLRDQYLARHPELRSDFGQLPSPGSI
ncbi:MAG: hypothetical protein HYV42_03165 [Candidatus Magasanikbacteria bacterium]|nr:hypothetical protein [Candidatus Magasanikbacteria bacterium]